MADDRKLVLVTGTGLVPADIMTAMQDNGLLIRYVADDYLDAAGLTEALDGVHGYVIGGYEAPLAEHFEAAHRLEVVAWIGTDYRSLVPGWARAAELGIAFVNAPGANAVSVAEYTMSLMLMMARPITAEILRPGGETRPLPSPGMELRGRTLGIIGLGRIGGHVARIARQGFGMDVVWTGPRRHPATRTTEGVEYVTKEELLATADVVSLHRPGRAEGEPPELGPAEFARLKPGAIVVNAGHPDLVDPEALLDACAARNVRAASDGVGEGAAWEALIALGPEVFLGVPSMAFNTREANRIACEVAIGALCEHLSATH